MKILEINKFHNAKRGADKHYLDVIELLKKGGHQVAEFSMLQKDNEQSEYDKYFLSTVGYGDNFSMKEKIKGVFRMFYSFEAHKKIKSLLDDFEPDLVHIHNIYHQMDPTILFEIKRKNIPIVMTVHDFKLINPNHSLRLNGKPYRRCAQGKYYQCILDKCVKNSYGKSFLAALEMYWHKWLGTYRKNIDLYISPSEFAKKILVSWGMDENKIVILPHFLPNEIEGKKYSFSISEDYALCMGKISKEKGIPELIEIFSKITGLKLYLAGEKDTDIDISSYKNVQYLGFLSKDQLKPYIQNAKCVVSGSKLPERFGLVALEAMANGKPFVGFSSGAYGEIIRNGIDGYIVSSDQEMKEAIEKIAREEIKSKKHKNNEMLVNFDAQIYQKKLVGIFQNLIDGTFDKNC